jgi:DNA replication protein DnaC
METAAPPAQGRGRATTSVSPDQPWKSEFLERARLDQARIPAKFAGKTFENFVTKGSARRKEILQAAKSYVDAFNFKNGPPRGLILKGVIGCGKTHIAGAILQAVIRKGYTGLYYNMVDLLSDIRSTYSDHSPLSEHELLQDVNEPDLLVLDDLGAEKTSGFVTDRLYLIVNRRYECCRPILITTNLSLAELEEKLESRIVSRLCEMSELVETFPAEDYRKTHMR